MRNKILILACVVVTVVGIVIMHEKVTIHQDTLYNQDVLQIEEQKNREKKTFITRGDAIKTAYKNFKNGLGIDLESKELPMVINLSSGKEEEQSYKWVMSWYKEGSCTTYNCTMDAITGEVISICEMTFYNEDLWTVVEK